MNTVIFCYIIIGLISYSADYNIIQDIMVNKVAEQKRFIAEIFSFFFYIFISPPFYIYGKLKGLL